MAEPYYHRLPGTDEWQIDRTVQLPEEDTGGYLVFVDLAESGRPIGIEVIPPRG